jgi:dehydrogenase/reductase SDR family protein 1
MELKGKVAVVTGASRGVGKGIAVELGAAGATVYVVARSAEPLAETAAAVTEAGGVGIAVTADVLDDGQTATLFDRIADEQGTVDIVVNSAFCAPDLAGWLTRPFWELPIGSWDQIIGLGTRAAYVAAVHAVPLMSDSGLIVAVSSPGEQVPNVSYSVGKAATDRLVAELATQLKLRGVAVFSLWPGLVRTEFLLAAARPTSDGHQVLDFPDGRVLDVNLAETPRFIGRAVVGLATDPARLERTGSVETTAALADRYGFTDIDGNRPPTSYEVG